MEFGFVDPLCSEFDHMTHEDGNMLLEFILISWNIADVGLKDVGRKFGKRKPEVLLFTSHQREENEGDGLKKNLEVFTNKRLGVIDQVKWFQKGDVQGVCVE